MYCEPFVHNVVKAEVSICNWGSIFRVPKDCVPFSSPNPTRLLKGDWLCLKPNFTLFFLTNSLTWNSWYVGALLDNNNHRKREFASPYTATSKFSIYIQNSTTFH